MRKALLFILMLLPLMANAQSVKKGYHGFVDGGICSYVSKLSPKTTEVTTSHGYQFNPYFFIGAGMGFDFTGYCSWGEISGHPYEKREARTDIPVFFNFRANLTKTRFCPFVDARLGAYVNNEGGIYVHEALGCRYAINEKLGVSFSVGYVARKVTAQYLVLNSYGTRLYYSYRDNPDQTLNGLIFKVGFDFRG